MLPYIFEIGVPRILSPIYQISATHVARSPFLSLNSLNFTTIYLEVKRSTYVVGKIIVLIFKFTEHSISTGY